MNKYNIAIFHEFKKPPWGGANQFTLALKRELESRDIKVLKNKVEKDTQACLLNSYLFNPALIKKIKQDNPKINIVHRVDGPVGIYRGTDLSADKNIHAMNLRFADATI